MHSGPVTNTCLNKTGCLPRINCSGFSEECPTESLKIHNISHTESQFELTPSGIWHLKVFPGCSILGIWWKVPYGHFKECRWGHCWWQLFYQMPTIGKGGHPILQALKADISPRALYEWDLLLGFCQTWLFSGIWNSMCKVWGQKELLLITFWKNALKPLK